MSHTKVQSQITLDAAKARWLLEETTQFVADRPLSKGHVALLASEMKQGRFLPEITSIVICKLNGTTYRLNGQHTATAILQVAEENDQFALPDVTLVTYTVKDETEMRSIYARIDRGAARTNMQVANSILVGTEHLAHVSKRVLGLLPVGLSIMYFENSEGRKIYAGETAATDVQGEFLELSLQVSAFMDELNPKTGQHDHMFRGSVVAALYATFNVDKDDALRFWKAVATGVGFESEREPAARLRQMLQNLHVHGGQQVRSGNQRKKPSVGQESMYRACLHAWNKFRQHGAFEQVLRPLALKSRPTVL